MSYPLCVCVYTMDECHYKNIEETNVPGDVLLCLYGHIWDSIQDNNYNSCNNSKYTTDKY